MESSHSRVASESSTKTLSHQSALLSLSTDNLPNNRGWRSISLRSYQSSSSEGSVTIPEDFESDECLIYLGFKKHAAADIMRQYFAAKAKLASTVGFDYGELVNLATSYVERAEDAWLPEHDWDSALKNMGMRKEVRVAILNPKFENLRLTGTAQSCAIDTIELRWDFLNSLDQAIARKAERLDLTI